MPGVEDTGLVGWWKPTETPAPAASPQPVPGHTPGGAAGPPNPSTAPPGPGQPRDGIYGRLVMTTWFFDTGITVTDDHTHHRRLVDIPPADEWDGCPGCGRPDGIWCTPDCEYAKDTE